MLLRSDIEALFALEDAVILFGDFNCKNTNWGCSVSNPGVKHRCTHRRRRRALPSGTLVRPTDLHLQTRNTRSASFSLSPATTELRSVSFRGALRQSLKIFPWLECNVCHTQRVRLRRERLRANSEVGGDVLVTKNPTLFTCPYACSSF
ncbi:hypothetical protein EVAR_25056_1 [Eumeta japonica]|uniref:Endonuclease/exonuclease/phosphatase domain-containing protein n=1 Tax=Eumeta variegata TaxID=151549 RepID=A0A4C1V6L9_EUMVA|nr:hypothetical protein EVAR_25056_1 [Eumeta japonica]